MIKKISFSKFISSITILALLAVIIVPLLVNAASITTASDTMTRLQISTTADHSIVFTLPTGVDFDSGDELRIDFPAGFAEAGVWVTGDFTVSDGSATDVNAVEDTAAPNGVVVGCTDDANNVGIEIDSVNLVFAIIPCGASYTASATAATITFTIDGTASDGTFTNPGSAGSNAISIANDEDNDSDNDDTTQIAVGIIDDDTVAVTATVNASVTFDLDTAGDDDDTCDTDESGAPYIITLGTITNSDSRVSGNGDGIDFICVDLDSNASGGVVVTVANTNGASGLVSTSVPGDDIDNLEGAIADNSENYGLCVVDSTASTGTLDDIGDYAADSCVADTETNDVGDLTVAGNTIFNTAGDPIAGGRGTIAVNASITIAQPAHDDYTDALTFIATGTF